MLIQLLNIAGIGPVIGVIIGIRFGEIVFVIIPVGCLLMGAVHDFVAGIMSMRHKGANLPELIRLTTGKHIYRVFSIFLCLALLLVVAVFINVPAKLASSPNAISNSHYGIRLVCFIGKAMEISKEFSPWFPFFLLTVEVYGVLSRTQNAKNT